MLPEKLRILVAIFVVGTVVAAPRRTAETAQNAEVTEINIGSRLEPFVDDYLIEKMSNVELRLNAPRAREVVLLHDQPWEGSCDYHTVFKDGDLYRMYYTANPLAPAPALLSTTLHICYAESRDGIHWVKPNLGLFAYQGSKSHNIVWAGRGAHGFSPFKDTNPKCDPKQRYKAVAMGNRDLVALASADGIHWSLLNQGQPVMSKGAFDSQNVAFFDELRGEYRAYVRVFRDGITRDIGAATSRDFISWTTPVLLDYPGAKRENLYTNQIKPYKALISGGIHHESFARGFEGCLCVSAIPEWAGYLLDNISSTLSAPRTSK